MLCPPNRDCRRVEPPCELKEARPQCRTRQGIRTAVRDPAREVDHERGIQEPLGRGDELFGRRHSGGGNTADPRSDPGVLAHLTGDPHATCNGRASDPREAGRAGAGRPRLDRGEGSRGWPESLQDAPFRHVKRGHPGARSGPSGAIPPLGVATRPAHCAPGVAQGSEREKRAEHGKDEDERRRGDREHDPGGDDGRGQGENRKSRARRIVRGHRQGHDEFGLRVTEWLGGLRAARGGGGHPASSARQPGRRAENASPVHPHGGWWRVEGSFSSRRRTGRRHPLWSP